MAVEALTGSRIRERRVMEGLKQSDLARDVGISASYLNLIEHNRRRIGGKLLLSIAQRLGTEPQVLTEGAEAALIATLREASVEAGLAGTEAAQAEEFAGRFPGWADVLASTRKRVSTLEETVEALSDRLAHDPHLAASMHELLSTAASIRSTAAILAETKSLQPEWRARFHANINEDSRRLSESAEDLLGHLNVEAADANPPGSPQEEVEAFLARHAFRFDVIEQGGADERTLERFVADAVDLRSQAARFSALNVLRQVLADAQKLSLAELENLLETEGPDPLRLAKATGLSVGLVLRRLAAVEDLGAGLVVCDRSGTIIFRKSVDGFTAPRHGACCPLWPLYGAFGQPGTVLLTKITQAGRSGPGFDSYAVAEPIGPPAYNMPPVHHAMMLLVPSVPDGTAAVEVGSTCRVCSLEPCWSRREPSILSVGI